MKPATSVPAAMTAMPRKIDLSTVAPTLLQVAISSVMTFRYLLNPNPKTPKPQKP